MFIHSLADVQTKQIGAGTKVWQFAIILSGASIGEDCNINCHTFIENDVQVGDRVTIKSGVYIWDGMRIASDAFIGPNVTFTNDKYPRSKQYPDAFQVTSIGQGASVGANATILGGISVGDYALIAAGSVVTKNVEPYTMVVGSPARPVGRVNKEGVVIERFDSAATL